MGGAGADSWGTADSFRFVYQPIADGDIVAHVTGESNGNAFAKTGVMIRQNVEPGSPHVILDVKPDGGLEFMTRSSQNGETTFIAGGSVSVTPTRGGAAMNVILRLTRNANSITASACGSTSGCQTIGTTSWLSGPALIGVAVTTTTRRQ